ncbi:MAG TPA: 16S rRNA (cytosine(1402)-N(4))-methyltransferase RsmH [candidate division Zixibacteria bacterium]|nr:16S rRNA (cytosine(1402)-N(4))-methyltransferase RsmH [candidate division Zixibacteria bacterium]HEQ99113.1 16S rRNA (cytosine(1402)-N(4))-methyltransferase RsmH [candidate division Zixibacteria bacterium]
MGKEVVEYLVHDPSGIYIDGTCGTGGHARLIAENLSDKGRVICCDLDPRMLELAKRRNVEVGDKIKHLQCGYHEVSEQLGSEDKPIAGFLLDLGISSVQLEQGYGFAFKSDNPLDMRFDPESSLTAADIINHYPLQELKKIFKEYGELSQAGPISHAIIRAREKNRIKTTYQFKIILEPFFKKEKLNKGLAQVAQALRIAVNNELENIKKGLRSLTKLLHSGGRLVVISYHSLEDRIVKNYIRTYSRESGLPPDLEEVLENREFRLKPLFKKALTPTSQELENNPRARSAKLRAAAKV